MNKKILSRLFGTCALSSCVLLAGPLQEARCNAPRGMQLSVRSYFFVTNSHDGTNDNTVEAYGDVTFNGQRVWYVDRDHAIDAVDDPTNQDPRKIIYISTHTYDVYFNEVSTWKLSVGGYLRDRDPGKKHDKDRGNFDDLMWGGGTLTRELNIKEIYESGEKIRRVGSGSLIGDQHNESADLRFTVTKTKDIY